MIRLIGACLLGLIVGLFLPKGLNMNFIFSFILPILLLSVGMSLGSVNILNLIGKNRKYLLLPLFSLIGSIVFSFVYALLMKNGIKETVLAGSAMGFYSLPAIMVSTQVGVVAGTLLLITNMIREALTILLAPLISKIFGKYSIIAVGGATTMDVSLAIIKEVGGAELVPIAILNGLVLTLVVPFITSLFIYLRF